MITVHKTVFSVLKLCSTQRTQDIESVFSVFTPFRVNTENTDVNTPSGRQEKELLSAPRAHLKLVSVTSEVMSYE